MPIKKVTVTEDEIINLVLSFLDQKGIKVDPQQDVEIIDNEITVTMAGEGVAKEPLFEVLKDAVMAAARTVSVKNSKNRNPSKRELYEIAKNVSEKLAKDETLN